MKTSIKLASVFVCLTLIVNAIYLLVQDEIISEINVPQPTPLIVSAEKALTTYKIQIQQNFKPFKQKQKLRLL
jgi:hypothetical protein